MVYGNSTHLRSSARLEAMRVGCYASSSWSCVFLKYFNPLYSKFLVCSFLYEDTPPTELVSAICVFPGFIYTILLYTFAIFNSVNLHKHIFAYSESKLTTHFVAVVLVVVVRRKVEKDGNAEKVPFYYC